MPPKICDSALHSNNVVYNTYDDVLYSFKQCFFPQIYCHTFWLGQPFWLVFCGNGFPWALPCISHGLLISGTKFFPGAPPRILITLITCGCWSELPQPESPWPKWMRITKLFLYILQTLIELMKLNRMLDQISNPLFNNIWFHLTQIWLNEYFSMVITYRLNSLHDRRLSCHQSAWSLSSVVHWSVLHDLKGKSGFFFMKIDHHWLFYTYFYKKKKMYGCKNVNIPPPCTRTIFTISSSWPPW